MIICPALKSDAASLLAIYEQYIHTNITFEYELPSLDEFSERIVETSKMYPYLICRDDSRIFGYAYAHQIQSREAYQWGAELSIYLDHNFTGHSWGTTLYARLMEILKAQGVRSVYGCVTTPNPASEKLHEKMGFSRIGFFRNAGFKNGAWHDITWFEKEIASHDCPVPLIPFPLLGDRFH